MLTVPAQLLEGRRPSVMDFTDHPSRTRQSFAQECDVNHIMARFEATGVVTHLNRVQGTYADVSQVRSFKEALDVVQAVRQDFYRLPSAVREQFGNDAASFLDAVQEMDEKAIQDLIYGPSSPDPVSPPASTPVEAPTASEAV